jgi:hypothetical protein
MDRSQNIIIGRMTRLKYFSAGMAIFLTPLLAILVMSSFDVPLTMRLLNLFSINVDSETIFTIGGLTGLSYVFFLLSTFILKILQRS